MSTISRTRLLAGAATLALTASLGAASGLAQQTNSDSMLVTAEVNQSCTVTSAGDLAFGPIDPGGDTATANSTFTVDCDFPGDVSVVVGNGENHNGTFRQMESLEGNFLRYQLFDSTGAQWNGSKPVTIDSTLTSTFTVDGAIGSSLSSGTPVGEYSDQVSIDVTF